MENIPITEAIFDKIESRKDGTYKFSFVTQEMPHNDAADFFQNLHQFGYLSFQPSAKKSFNEEPKEVKTISDAKYLRDLCVQFAGGGDQGRDYYEQFKRERGVEHLSELPEDQIKEEIRNFENILQINQ